MRTLYLVRGYPGLGRVMGSIAFQDILSDFLSRDNASLFASYLSGFTYLSSAGLPSLNLYPEGYPYQPKAFLNPFGRECRLLLSAVRDFLPDLVVLDGEPLCVEFFADILKRPILILTNPSDLHNPGTPNNIDIDLFRHYYAKANLVIAHGLERLPPTLAELGGRAGTAIDVNTLIRTPIASAAKQRRERPATRPNGKPIRVLGVLGGGSENVTSEFRTNTIQLAEWLISACDPIAGTELSIYCADNAVYERVRTFVRGDVKLISQQMDNTSDLVQADVIVGRAGRNLVSEILALGTRSLIVPVPAEPYRTSDQHATAGSAAHVSEVLRTTRLADGYDAFVAALHELFNADSAQPRWAPGNDDIRERLPSMLSLLGL